MQSRRSRHPWALFALVLGFAFVHDATADTVTAYKHCEVWRPPGAPAPAPRNCSWHGATFFVKPSGQIGAHEITGTAIWDHNSTQFDRNMHVSIFGIGTNQETARFDTNPPWGSGAQPIPRRSPIYGQFWEASGRIDLPPNLNYMASILSSKMGPGCYTFSGPNIRSVDDSGETCSNWVQPSSTGPDQIPVLVPVVGEKFAGGALWAVQFSLPHPAAKSGFIIQELLMSESGTRSNGQTAARTWHYWEAWPVIQGQQTITDPNSRETVAKFVQDRGGSPPFGQIYQQYCNDIFFKQYALRTKGWAEWRAVAAFYEKTLPQDFVPNNPDTESGNLLSTTASPPFWNGTGLVRRFRLDFDFRRTRTKADITVQGGALTNGTMTSPVQMTTIP